MEQVGPAAPGEGLGSLGHRPEAPSKQIWKGCPAYQRVAPAWPLRPWRGVEGCGRHQALGQLPEQVWTLAPSTHLVWAGTGHTRSPPKRPPHCHSSPLGQSAPAGGWHTGKEAMDMCHHFCPPLLGTEVSQESPRRELPPPHPGTLPEDTPTRGRAGKRQRLGADRPAVHSARPQT